MARTDTLANFVTDVANAIRTKSGKSELISPSNFDNEIINLPAAGSNNPEDKGYPILIDSSINYSSGSGASYTLNNSLLHKSNYSGYYRNADLALVVALVRGGSYSLSDNLTLIGESEWQEDTYTGGSFQKVIIAKADLESTDNYIITNGVTARMQVRCLLFLNAGEPEFVESFLTTEQQFNITIPDNDTYLYAGAMMWLAGSANSMSFSNVLYLTTTERLGICLTEKAGEISALSSYGVDSGRWFTQVVGMRIPYKRHIE